MRIIIRLIAVLFAAVVVLTVWFILYFWSAGGLTALLQSGALGVTTIVGWIVTLLLAPYAAVRLWQFRRGGLSAAAVLCGFAALYYAAGIFFLRTPEAPVLPLVAASAANALLLALLLSPPARRVCAT